MESRQVFDMPWIEKYRPDKLDDVVGHKEIIEQLRRIAEIGNMPNLILAGPPGTGKTTSVLALSHELLGTNFKKAVIELNASDERGLNTVRDKIKSFANQKVNLPPNRHKIVILDEADNMTEQAQQALRVIISDFSATTRFAIACNDSTKIIEPIQSRCCVLRFNKLLIKDIKERVQKIMDKENIPYDIQGLNDIVETCDGDLRCALNNLQSTYIGFGKITHENVFKIVDIPKPEEIDQILNHCKKGEIIESIEKLDILYGMGYRSLEIINAFGKIIKNSKENLNEQQKLILLKMIDKYKLRFLNGIDSDTQMYGFLSELTSFYEEAISGSKKTDDIDIMDIC